LSIESPAARSTIAVEMGDEFLLVNRASKKI
jgi:hypothetical protein